MAIINTVKPILKEKNITQKDLAERLNTSKQNLGNKFRRDTFYPNDLIDIAEALEMRIAFVDEYKGKMYFLEKDSED